MENINSALARIFSKGVTNEGSSDCVECGRLIEAKEFEVFGKKMMFKGVCQCVQDAKIAETKRMQQRTIDSEKKSLFNIGTTGVKYKDLDFSGYMVNEGNETVFKWASGYVKTFDKLIQHENKKGKGFNFWGEPGNGKTMLVSIMANELRKQGYNVVLVSMKSLLSEIKATYNKENPGTEDRIMKGLTTCDLLIIDDIGAERLTEWAQETLFEIVDARYDKKKPIVTTSNIHPDLWEDRMGPRINDRFSEILYHGENKNKSLRKKKSNADKDDFFNTLFDDEDDEDF